MEGVFNMTKSLIEQRNILNLLERFSYYKTATMTFDEFVLLLKTRELAFNLFIQKALEELKKNRYCNSTIAFHICDKNPDDCNFIVDWLDIEKCFGEVKDDKNK